MTTAPTPRHRWQPDLRTLLAVLTVGLVFVAYQPGATGWLQQLLLPAMLAIAAWLLVRSVVAVALGVALLATAHSNPGGSGLAGTIYPWLAGAAWLALLLALGHRFRGRMAATRAGRLARRTPASAGPVPLATVLPLRQTVLRPGQPAAAAAFAGDLHPQALHLAVQDGSGVLAVASLLPAPCPDLGDAPQAHSWQLRGMATAPAARRQGHGGRLLDLALAHAREQGGELVWCNARPAAEGLYRSRGFTAQGAPFDIAGIGSHQRMVLPLVAPADA